MAQQPPNGAGATHAALYSNAAALNGSLVPPAGHYADMQTLMQSMEQLSGWLQQNREEFAHVQERLAVVERRGLLPMDGEKAGVLNGDGGRAEAQPRSHAQSKDAPDDEAPPTTLHLTHQIATLTSRLQILESQLLTHEKLATLYESTLAEATDRIRQYCFEQNNYILSLHQHYTRLLEQSGKELVEAQMMHQAWQEGLGRLSASVREAWKSREEEKRPWVGKLRGLREENRVLRRMVGWEEAPVDSDDDEEGEEEEEEEEGPGRGAGRSSHRGGGRDGLGGMGGP